MQLSFATEIQLHATHATTNLCNSLKHVAHDMQLHVTVRMQLVYTMVVYMFIHTYQSNIVAPYVQLSLQLHATNENMTHVLKIRQLACGHVSFYFIFSVFKIKNSLD